MRTWIGALIGVIVLTSHAGAATGIIAETTTFADRERKFYLYVPDSAKPRNAPLVVLLHGSFSDGIDMARLWQPIADREGIILVAPNALHKDGWRLKLDGPDFVCAVADDIATRYGVDRRRLYLFGQSGGAVFALHLAMLEANFFAAAAVHAGSWREPKDFNVLQFAQRRIALSIIVGDHDEFFSLASVRHTETVLRDAGFPIEVTVVPGQDHWYVEKVAPEINDRAWRFMSAHPLDSDAVYTRYR